MRYGGFFLCEVVVVLAVLSMTLLVVAAADKQLASQTDKLLQRTIKVVALPR